ncbi:MAG: YdbH domain-containing protein [Planctomycetota bacterium]|nr:YdbH domain-containing protein [Planctomycetota bacterium]
MAEIPLEPQGGAARVLGVEHRPPQWRGIARYWRRGLVILLSIFGAIWLAETTFLPWVVSRELAKILASLGFANASFSVRDVSLTRAVVAQFAAGRDDEPTVDAAVIRYSPLALIRGRIDDIELTGARLLVDVDHHQLMLGRNAVAPPTSRSTSAAISFPFARIILRSCDLVLRQGAHDYWVPFAGTIENTGNGKLELALSAHEEGTTLTIGGGLDTVGNVDVTLDAGNLNLSALVSTLSSQLGTNIKVTGSADAHLRYKGAPGNAFLHVGVIPQQVTIFGALGNHRLSIENLDGNLQADLDSQWNILALNAAATIENAALDHLQTARKVAISIVNDTPENSHQNVHLTMQADEIALSSGRFGVGKVSTEIHLTLPATGQNIRAGTTGRAVVSIGTILVAGLSLPAADSSQPMAVISLSASQDANGIAVTVEPSSSLTIPAASTGGVLIHLPKVTLAGAGHFLGNSTPSALATVHFDKASADFGTGQFGATDITGDIPLRWNAAVSGARVLTIGGLHIGPTTLPSITAAATIDPSAIAVDAHWPILPGAELSAHAAYNPQSGQTDILGNLPEFHLTDPDAMAALLPAAKGAAITGFFSGKGELHIGAGRVMPGVTFSFHDVLLEDKAYDARLEGISTTVTADSFAPLTTPGDQQIQIKKAHIGKLDLSNGSANFRAESARAILIEKSKWDWEDGVIHTDAFRIDPISPKLAFSVDGYDLNLKSVLATFSPGQATGEGRLYGRFPIRVDWPKISFGKGFLYSAPGPGTVQLDAPMTAKVGDMLDSSDPRFKTDDQFKEIKSRALLAMKDFQYDVIKADWQSTPNGVVGTLHLEGKGRQGANGQALNLNINFQNLDRALTRYLIIRKGSSGKP